MGEDAPDLKHIRHTHDLLTAFMSAHGFKVTRHYLGLETAWRAEFSNGSGGRVLGINSEMDALRGIGHACGHNLIAISGVGIAIAVKKALETHNVPGKVVLLGTPGKYTLASLSASVVNLGAFQLTPSRRRWRWEGDTARARRLR